MTTVSELIERLSTMPQDATVIVVENAGSPVLGEYFLEVGDVEYREQATEGDVDLSHVDCIGLQSQC